MEVNKILAEIDAQIAKLQQARALLAGEAVKRGPGRPKSASAAAPAKKHTKRILSAEARKKIAEAQKRRWAKQKQK